MALPGTREGRSHRGSGWLAAFGGASAFSTGVHQDNACKLASFFTLRTRRRSTLYTPDLRVRCWRGVSCPSH